MATKSAYKALKVHYEDIERKTSNGEEILDENIPAALQKRIVEQVNEEHEVAFKFNEAKRTVWLARLLLYNNQKRQTDAVGDPLMFTVFNTVLASLYDDKLSAICEGRGGEGDADIEENVNGLIEYDYDAMHKDELDYFWDWDSCFFGRGLVLQMEFSREKMLPMPELIDPTVWIRDPRAKSVNGDAFGRGAMRFGGYETGATYYELKGLPGYFNIEALRKDNSIRDELLQTARDARAAAQGNENFPQREESLGKYNNYEFKLLNWFTHIKGQKYLVTLGNRMSVIVRLMKLPDDDRWPITDRALYPMSHDWDGVCVPDFTEDKQRARAVLINLGLKSAKADAMPRYLFDKDRIKNEDDLNYRSNKYIPVNGRVDNALLPVPHNNPSQYVAQIMDMLDQAAQRAMATPEIQQGVPSSDKRTLGELQLVSSRVDTRYSMSAKVFGWSERQFWRQHYRQYKRHFKDKIDEKIIRIQGAMAPIWRPLNRENIIAEVDPDIKIESRVLSEAKRKNEQQGFSLIAGLALQDPTTNRRFFLKKGSKLVGWKKEEIDMAFPRTPDEMQAEDENEILNVGKLPKIGINDDHQIHINIHAKADQNPQTMAHVRAHKKLMILKRDRPDLFPAQPVPSFQQPGSAQIPGAPAAPALANQ